MQGLFGYARSPLARYTTHMKLLISNDDGIYAPGVLSLANALAKTGQHQLTVICPDRERSATGHALTLHKPLRVEQVQAPYHQSIAAWACSGTPADCVKLGLDGMLSDCHPDWVIAGINHGANLGTDVLYSGTVSAAMEGLMVGLPSMAVSLASSNTTDFQAAAHFVCQWLETCRDRPFPGPALLNVNVPPVPTADICGVVAAPLGMRHYTETFEKRVDPRGKTYYWIAGEAIDTHAAPESDIAAIRDNYITVTPLGFNLTAGAELPKLADWGMSAYVPTQPKPALTREA